MMTAFRRNVLTFTSGYEFGGGEERRIYSALRPDFTIALVGCGGTGSLLAEGLMRLLLNYPDAHLILVDGDTVEERNLLRQNFYPEEIGGFKSEVLANRLARRFQRPVAYITEMLGLKRPENDYLGAPEGTVLHNVSIIIGAVDNPMARKSIASQVSHSTFWVDSGNGDHYGQVLIGNARKPSKHDFDAEGHCFALPLPTVQRAELLLPAAESEADDPSCALAVQLGQQSPVINQIMAALTLEVVRRLITGTCSWMALSVALDQGQVTPIMATPENAAAAWQVKTKEVITK